MQLDKNDRSAATMRQLGYAGLIPFVLLAVCILSGPDNWATLARQSLLGYAAVILTFVGAVHWGRVLAAATNSNTDPKILYWAVTPSLIAWIALMLPHTAASVVMAVGFALCWWVDRALYRDQLAGWYMGMRSVLTITVVATLLLGML